jgi:MFS family permease
MTRSTVMRLALEAFLTLDAEGRLTVGMLAPLTQLMMARVAGKQLARVLGYAVVPVLVAPILGPVLAGAILKRASWPWVFYVNLPIGVFAVGPRRVAFAGRRALPGSSPL